MSEQQVDTTAVTDTQEQTPQYTEIEQRALQMGWRPKEEFSGDEADFVEAKEFVARAPLFEKIDHQNREIKNVKKALDALTEHYSKVKETEYQRALEDLKTARKEALREGDADKFEKYDDAIDKVEAEAARFKEEQAKLEVPNEPTIDPRFTAWTARNPWYSNQPHMRVFADDVGIKLARQGMSPDEVLKEVEKAVKAEFPSKFRNQNKDKPGAVETPSTRRESTSSASDTVELTDQERKIMNTLVSQGVLTKEKYLSELKAAKARGR